jgi:hypothetical protein
MAVWCSLWSFGIFFPFWYVLTEKNLATLPRRRPLPGLTGVSEDSEDIASASTDGAKRGFFRCPIENLCRVIVFFVSFIRKSSLFFLLASKVTVSGARELSRFYQAAKKQRAFELFRVPKLRRTRCTNTETPGADVMATIFCDFRQFSAKKLALFLKSQCYDKIFA